MGLLQLTRRRFHCCRSTGTDWVEITPFLHILLLLFACFVIVHGFSPGNPNLGSFLDQRMGCLSNTRRRRVSCTGSRRMQGFWVKGGALADATDSAILFKNHPIPYSLMRPTFQLERGAQVPSFGRRVVLAMSFSVAESWESNEEGDDGDEDEDTENDDASFTEEDEEVSVDPQQLLVCEYEKWMQSVDKAVEALRKKEKSLQSELEKAEKVQGYTARADLLKSNLWMFTPGVKTATVQDWERNGASVELRLNNAYQSATEEVEALYQQVRKLKRGSQVVGPLLEETRQALGSLLEMQSDLDAACLLDTDDGMASLVDKDIFCLMQDRLMRSSRITGFAPPTPAENGRPLSPRSKQQKRKPQIGTPASNIRKMQSDAGCTILIGRNRRGNEHISLSVARGDDVWMHARGTPGAHVLIQQRRGGPTATPDCLQLAANVAAFYSDARGERKVEVTVAEPKHVQKPRGAPLGAVKVREEQRVLLGHPDDVPLELKEARAVSGLSDEYRITDKAKLRKQNKQQVAKQKQKAKQKAKQKTQEKREVEKFY